MARHNSMNRRFGVALSAQCLMILGLWGADPSLHSILIGLGFGLSGCLIFFWLRGYGDQGEQDRIGPFRIMAHPQFLARILIAIGLLVAARSTWVWCLCLLLIVAWSRVSKLKPERRQNSKVPSLFPTLVFSEAVGATQFSFMKAADGFGHKDWRLVLLLFYFMSLFYLLATFQEPKVIRQVATATLLATLMIQVISPVFRQRFRNRVSQC